MIASANFSVSALCLRQNAAENDEVILTYFEEFLAKMTENLQASADKARRALIVRCCLKSMLRKDCAVFNTFLALPSLRRGSFFVLKKRHKAAGICRKKTISRTHIDKFGADQML